ncbi:hypothetical protein M2308_000777 [Rhizobium leguminosarum]|nr:hypothetical protein [Rhizobium leguminosarum]
MRGRANIGTSMAIRDRFSKKLSCPQCGNEGFAEASEVDDPKRKHPDFKVDQLPRGFGVQRPSNHQENFMIKCECGRKFPFRSLAEAAAERR